MTFFCFVPLSFFLSFLFFSIYIFNTWFSKFFIFLEICDFENKSWISSLMTFNGRRNGPGLCEQPIFQLFSFGTSSANLLIDACRHQKAQVSPQQSQMGFCWKKKASANGPSLGNRTWEILLLVLFLFSKKMAVGWIILCFSYSFFQKKFGVCLQKLHIH